MYKDIEIRDVKDFILKQFGEIPDISFYKGISTNRSISDFLITDYSEIRKSKTVNIHGNYYNTLLNSLDSWQSLPKRDRSIIFTNQIETAIAFGTDSNYKFGKTYAVIPANRCKVVISPDKDIWESFTKGLSLMSLKGANNDLTKFNSLIHNIFKAYGVDGSLFSLNEIESNLENILNIEIKKKLDFDTGLLFNALFKQKNDIPKFLNKCFSPGINNFKIKKYELNWNLESSNNEMWTDSQAVLINIDLFSEILI